MSASMTFVATLKVTCHTLQNELDFSVITTVKLLNQGYSTLTSECHNAATLPKYANALVLLQAVTEMLLSHEDDASTWLSTQPGA